jgi:hypothetical protein
MIFFGSAAGIGDVIGVKVALIVVTLGGTLSLFNERLQGGISTK